jgi:hypothetical protein
MTSLSPLSLPCGNSGNGVAHTNYGPSDLDGHIQVIFGPMFSGEDNKTSERWNQAAQAAYVASAAVLLTFVVGVLVLRAAEGPCSGDGLD